MFARNVKVAPPSNSLVICPMFSLLLSVLLVAETPATDAATASTAAATVPAAEAPKKERKICRRDVVSTSLHGSKRTCLTRSEWKARERNATLEDMGGVTTK